MIVTINYALDKDYELVLKRQSFGDIEALFSSTGLFALGFDSDHGYIAPQSIRKVTVENGMG